MTVDSTAPPVPQEAETALEAGRLDEAETLFRTHLGAHPGDAHAHNRLGVCLVRAGRLQEAASSFEAALRYDARHARAATNLGNLRLEAGDLAGAEAMHRQALALDPELAYAWTNLAAVLKRQRRFGEAVAAQKRAARLSSRQHAEEARHEFRAAAAARREERAGRPRLTWLVWLALAAAAYFWLWR